MAPRAGFASGSVMNFAENAHCSFYRAHRSVLAASSPYFDSILRMQKVAVEHLSISCRNQSAFQSFLRYMYSGCVSVHRGNVAELLQLSNHFLVFKLKNYCAEYLEHNLNLANCLTIREMAEANNVPTLLKAVASFVSENVEDVLNDPRLLRLDRERFVAFISDRRLCLPQGAPLLNLVTRWVSHDLEEREGWLRLLLTSVVGASIFCFETLDSNMVEAPKCSSVEKREQLRLEFSQGPESDWESFMNLAVSAAIEALCAEMSGEARGSPGALRSAAEEEDDEDTLSSDDCGELLDEDDGSENTLGMGGDKIHLRQQQAAVDDENSTEGESDEKHHILRNLLVGKKDAEAAKTSEPEATTDDSSNGQTPKLSSSVWKAGVKCEHCSYVSYGAARLEQHVAKAHGKGKTYACPLCTYTCKWNREYYTHMKHHFSSNGEGPFQCDSCAYKCERIQLLLLHRMRHTDERPYQCGVCDYRCRQKTNLVAHMRCHTDACTLEMSFVASLPGCTYVSPKRSQLEAHMRTHTAVRSHVCAVCGRAFIERSHLVRHERIHLDDKPFKCLECDYTSSRRDKLKEHHEKHHGENATAKAPYRPRKTSSSAGQMLVDSVQLGLDDTYVSTDSQLDPTDPDDRYLVVQMQASGLSLSQIQALQSHSSLDDSSSMIAASSELNNVNPFMTFF
ncbi:hypothetical protein MRX96_005061 [Rhipicephalus microplus]